MRNARTTPGEGPVGGYEAYKSAARTYPANVIPPSMVQNAKNTFNRIAAHGDPQGNNHWQAYGALQNAIEPGVLAFTGKTDTTATRSPVLVIAPTCVPGNCRLWVGAAGGGVWRTDDALAANPSWTYLTGGIAQNSVGALTADPNDSSGNTLYLGYRRGQSLQLRLRSGRRYLQDHERRQQLDEARRHLREQRHVRVRHAGY